MGSAPTRSRPSRVHQVKRRRENLLAFCLAIAFALLVGMVLFFHVWSRLQVIDLGYALAAQRTVRQKLQEENRELRLELATLTSPERLESAARFRLGMHPPKTEEVIILP
jgi:cell division protein FtsL